MVKHAIQGFSKAGVIQRNIRKTTVINASVRLFYLNKILMEANFFSRNF